jgi:hypothetical protein
MIPLTRQDILAHESHLADAGFRSDTDYLLRRGIVYEPGAAGAYVRSHLVNRLP